MRSDLRTRMGLIFSLGLLLLIISSIIMTLVVTGLMDRDQAAVELLHRQIALAKRIPQVVAAGQLTEWEAIVRQTEQTLLVMVQGGVIADGAGRSHTLPPLNDEPLLTAMQQATQTWQGLRRRVDLVIGGSERDRAGALADLEALQTRWLAALEGLIQGYNATTRENLAWLRGIQMAFFLSAVVLLLEAYWLTHRTLVMPVETLQQAAQRITQGDLTTPVESVGSTEFRELAQTLETMRVALKQSQDLLRQDADHLAAQVAQRTQTLATLYQVITIASRSLNPVELLESALLKTLDVMGLELGGIWLLASAAQDILPPESGHQPECEVLRLAAHHGFQPELLAEITCLPLAGTLTGQVAQTGLPLTVSNITQENVLVRAALAGAQVHSLAAVPLQTKAQLWGVMDILTLSERSFTVEEMALLVSIAQQISLALENITLLRRMQRQTRRVALLEERERIAAEMHDSVAQTLGYLHLQLDRAAQLAATSAQPALAAELTRWRQVLEQTSLEVRRFIGQLSQPPPAPALLQELVAQAITAFYSPTGAQLQLQDALPAPLHLPAAIHTQVSRILGEALHNTRHAQARQVTVRLSQEGDELRLTVADDGQGFDPAQPLTDGEHHFGLRVMQARAARIGGRLEIHSAPGQGTTVTLHWPVEGNSPLHWRSPAVGEN